MNILIIGCGDIGSRLANTFSRLGHQVSVVDRNADQVSSLDKDFDGLLTIGVAIDQDVLCEAGIQGCDAVISVTRDDNVNLMVAQLARDIFHVPRVISRVSDPSREEVFSSFGLSIVSPTMLTVDSVVAALDEWDDVATIHLGTSHLTFTRYEVDRRYLGEYIDVIPLPQGYALLGLMRPNGQLRLQVGERLRLQDGDYLMIVKVIGGLKK